MRTSRRIWVALATWLMLMIGAEGAVAQASPVSDTSRSGNHVAQSPQQSSRSHGQRLDFSDWWSRADRPPSPIPPSPPARLCPATGITGSPTDRPSIPFERYYLGDWRLGPKVLPKTGPVGVLLKGYQRTDSLSPNKFIACYWDPTADNNKGGWRYPPNGGFADGTTPVTFQTGQFIDRFGPNSGRFLSPYGSPFAQRALPPSNLDTFEARYPNDYHIFRVLKPFTADGGTAAPWFGQPGGGIQYRLDDKYFPGEVMPPEHANTQWLIDHQYLQPIN